MTDKALNITWITQSLRDYRIPVFNWLDTLCDHRLHVLYSARWTPRRVQQKMADTLEYRAVAFQGERGFGKNDMSASLANTTVYIPYQPGLIRTAAKTRPDVVIGDGFFQWTAAALALKIGYGIPLVVCYERTFHTERHAQWYRILYRRLAIRWVDAMCCNGRLTKEYSVWLGMNPRRITVGQMAADNSQLARQVCQMDADTIDQLRKGLAVKGLMILYVGQIIERKGLRHLVETWLDLERQYPQKATLVLVGDGPQRAELVRWCQDQGVSGIRFAGKVDYDHIAKFYAAADAFVIPTLEDNWSLVVPEAMACGLPVLCSKYNGCWPELVTNRNGWVFDPLDHGNMFQALKSCLMTSKEELAEMGAMSQHIVDRFSPKKAATAIYEACRIAVS